MIRNYNGNVNRKILRDLERLCDVNSQNFKILMDEFTSKGKVTLCTNNDPFTGLPDELSKINVLKSEEEIKEFLKEDFKERLTGYLKGKDTEDYLLSALIEFIKKSNGIFPNKDEMRKIEKDAETKRIVNLPADQENTPKDITYVIALEILQLAEEIMESRRKTNPKDVFTPVEPYSERMHIAFDRFAGCIYHECYYGYDDYRDYRLALCGDSNLETKIFYDFEGNPIIEPEKLREEECDISWIKYLTVIHKGIVKIAKCEGIEFESEIDYDKLLS